MEEWKDVKGYEEFYEVSNLGRVKSLGRRGSGCILTDRILKPRLDGKGYPFVTLCIKRKQEMYRVHRLVCLAFHENPNNLPSVNHLDETRTNNKSTNLEWITHRANINYTVNKTSTSIYPGVHWVTSRNRWRVYSRFNGKQVFLGHFKDELKAAEAYIDFCEKNNLH
jgi:hypothetical protein